MGGHLGPEAVRTLQTRLESPVPSRGMGESHPQNSNMCLL
jgi:hypothetical protein